MNRLSIAVLASSFLSFTGSAVSAQTARARITSTPIRGEANLASAIIATVQEGGLVDVVDLQGTGTEYWFQANKVSRWSGTCWRV